jgi:hypothetical protein
MKSMKTIITLCLIITAPVLLTAQDIDNTRMDRDLRIMENILVELFVPKAAPRIAPVDKVDGQYLPGYGVYFTIPARVNIRAMNVRRLGNDGDEVRIQVDPDRATDLIPEDEVRSLATEFLKNYAPTISQLQPDNKITVIYGVKANRYAPGSTIVRGLQGSIQNTDTRFTWDRERQTDQPDQKIVTVTATKKNLDDFRTGRMNDSRFESTLAVSISDINDRKQDLNLFKTILESAHSQQEEVVFRLSIPDYLYFDHLGVIFQSTLSISSNLMVASAIGNALTEERFFRGGSNRSELEAAFFDGGMLMRSLAGTANLPDSVVATLIRPTIRVHRDSTLNSQQVEEIVQRFRSEIEQRERERREAIEALDLPAALNTSLGLMKEVLIDYGRTLSSVNSDQHILISLNVVARNVDGLPSRVDLQIKKSDLEEMEIGRITRDQALSRIIERRF